MVDGPAGKFHFGFAEAYRSIRSKVRLAVRLDDAERVWVTGHSLCGAMALLCAEDILEDCREESFSVATFGVPMIADHAGAAYLNKRFAGRYQRFVNGNDVVPRIPPNFAHGRDRVRFHDCKGIR